jgi:hypothetical protein
MTDIDAMKAVAEEGRAAAEAAVADLEVTDPAVEGLVGWLAQRDVFFNRMSGNKAPEHWKYRSAESFVLGEGQAFDASQVRYIPGIDGTPKNCFQDAMNLAVERRWSYCEGWAIGAAGIDVHHAWCVDDDGMVVDPTWQAIADLHDEDFPYPGSAYVGLVLNVEVAWEWVAAKGSYGVLYEKRFEALLEHGLDGFDQP